MPTYTYRCQACSNVLEKRQSFGDAPLTTCETCGGELRKMLHPVGIVFKGSGFYNTDYRGSNGAGKTAEPGKDEGKDKDTASSSSATPSDTTAAPKSDTPSTSPPAKAESSPASAKAD